MNEPQESLLAGIRSQKTLRLVCEYMHLELFTIFTRCYFHGSRNGIFQVKICEIFLVELLGAG